MLRGMVDKPPVPPYAVNLFVMSILDLLGAFDLKLLSRGGSPGCRSHARASSAGSPGSPCSTAVYPSITAAPSRSHSDSPGPGRLRYSRIAAR